MVQMNHIIIQGRKKKYSGFRFSYFIIIVCWAFSLFVHFSTSTCLLVFLNFFPVTFLYTFIHILLFCFFFFCITFILILMFHHLMLLFVFSTFLSDSILTSGFCSFLFLFSLLFLFFIISCFHISPGKE
jgi:hypothetical protein